MTPGYAFDNDSAHAAEQHRCLAIGLDGATTRALTRLEPRRGMRCLEVGAGGGSIARWLAERVAPGGSVLATDVKPHHIPRVPGLTVEVHDITRDPLPEAAFDLVHARLVLLHLPERRAVLERLARSLKPGGWLQLDEFDETTYGPLVPVGELDDGGAAERAYAAYLAAKLRLLESAGVELSWGRSVATEMSRCGLRYVHAVPEVQAWHHDSPGTALQIHNTRHLRDRFRAAGLGDAGLAAARRVMAHRDFLATSCVLYCTQGRRP
ncbi:class I SAM-dependent methyltransferase [Streptomyces sp. NPDC004610]|uniref:class I SAM-dependent methyltransferase n=1 Tax=unclassified Streptomyces TaxID=2593676 RepID=UPI0033B15AA0